MPRKRNSRLKETSDFWDKVDFFGIRSDEISSEDRIRVVQDILKIWTLRTHRRGRPPKDEGSLDNAA